MMTDEIQRICRSCGGPVTGRYCPACGENMETKRLTVKGLLHEAFHFFTHFDKGFPYTLKKLIIAPGTMQKEYVNGFRSKYQKPFSMFFICATLAALALYWINISLVKYFDAGDAGEAEFFHQYWVILQVIMMPLYTLITYLFFRESKMNYAEILVFQLYLFSFLFLVLTLIHLLKFISPHLQTRYIELPVIILYTVITNFNFFYNRSKWIIIAKTVLAIGISFLLASYLQDLLVESVL